MITIFLIHRVHPKPSQEVTTHQQDPNEWLENKSHSTSAIELDDSGLHTAYAHVQAEKAKD